MGLIGFISTMIGVVLFTCVQFEETFVWPILAGHAPGLLTLDGSLFKNPAYFSVYMLMGVLWVIGFVILGIVSFRSGIFSKIASLLIIPGAVIFGLVISLIIVRTVGVILFSTGIIWIGSKLARLPEK